MEKIHINNFKLKKKVIFVLLLFIVLFYCNNINADTINRDKYQIITNDQQQVIQIKQFKDSTQQDLIKHYLINDVDYNEDINISDYLNYKYQVINISDNLIQSKTLYKNNKIINYVKYENNINYSNANINNIKNYSNEYIIENDFLKNVNVYYEKSSKTQKQYTMHKNIKFDYKIKGYKNIYYFNKDGYITSRNYYPKVDQLSKKYYYYSKATKNTLNNKIKYRKAYNNKGYLTSYLSYYTNGKYKNYVSYYSKTKDNNNKSKHKKYIIKNNSKGYIKSKVLKSNNKQRNIKRYYYKNNAILFKNNAKKLKQIKYYTYNRGKVKNTGYKKYKNGKVVSSYVILKNVPYYNQMNEGYPSGCEFFSLKMALGYKGKNVVSSTLYKKMNKSMSKPYKKNGKWRWANPDKKFLGNPKGIMAHNRNWGINPKGLKLLGDKYSTTAAKSNFSVNQIRNELLKGNPVIVWSTFKWTTPAGYFYYTDSDGNKRFTYGNFHVMTVVGMDNKYMHMYDPAIGKKKVSIKKFKKSYKPYGQKALVVK